MVGKDVTDEIRDVFFAFSDKCVEELVPDLIFAQVLVNGAENSALAGRIGVSNPAKFEIPELFLYKKGESTKSIRFPNSASFDVKGLKEFVSKHTGIEFKPPGLTSELDEHITRFAAAAPGEERGRILAEAEEHFKDNKSEEVKVFLKALSKAAPAPDAPTHITAEIKRVEGLLTNSNPKAGLSIAKKSELRTKVAILKYLEKKLSA